MQKPNVHWINPLLAGLVFLCVLAPSQVYAQAPDLDLRFDFVFDLGAQAVQTFHQDRFGFLWIGTAGDGLFRYDGYTLKHYGAGPEGLSNGYIYGLVEDSRDPNILWIGTKGGLNRFNRRTETYTYYRHDPDDPQSLSHNAINTVIQDTQDPNLLWVGTDGGLNRFDKQTETFTRYTPKHEDPHGLLCPEVWRVIQDITDPHIFWLGTWGCGLHRFDKRTEQFTAYLHDPEDPQSYGAADNVVSIVAQDKDEPDILWLGSVANGLDKFDQRTETFTHYTHDPQVSDSIVDGTIALIYDDGEGTLWLGGWVANNGLTLMDKATGTFRNYRHNPDDPHSLSGDQVVDIYKSRAGILWILGLSGKVDKLDPWGQKFTLYQQRPSTPNSLAYNAVTTMYEDDHGMVWLGTHNGLSKLDLQTETFANYTHDPADPASLPMDYVQDIVQDPSGDLWVSLFPGPLVRLDQQTGRTKLTYQGGIESFTFIVQDPDQDNILWVGTRPHGFARFDKRAETLTFYDPNPQNPELGVSYAFMYVAIYDEQEGVIWIGGWEGGGLNRFDRKTQRFMHYLADPEDPHSIAVDAIAALYKDAAGALWIGTLGGGLDRFDIATETFTHYGEDYDIPSMVNGILEDDTGNLWLSTDSGIVKFNPITEQVEKRYTEADGLQGDTFISDSALKTQDGDLWFGGTNGVNRFNPETLVQNPYVPPVVLTAFTQGGDPYAPDIAAELLGSVTLDWQHNFFEFEYTALNYTQPQQNQYRYILEGVDRAWYDAGSRRFGRYTGLEPGQYILQIIGSNNDGVWNEAGVTLAIQVLPPLWRTWWFITLVVGVAVAGVGTLTWSEIQRRRAERATAQAVRESEARLRHVVQNMPVMMDAFDEENMLLVWNRECERVTGYSASEMIGNLQALEKLYPDPAYRQDVLTMWAEREDDWRNLETQVTGKDGDIRTVAWSNISQRFPIPEWAEWAIGVDITERKKAEAERERLLVQIRAQMQRVQDIIDTVPEGVLLLNHEGRVILANPVAERALVILAEAGVGDVITHLGESHLSELLTSPPTRGLWHEVEAEQRVFELIARPMGHHSGQPEDWVLLLRDVTREREIQRRAQQQERLAAVGQLAAGIAHDFNNIMATITLYAQMTARAKGLTDRNRERMEVVNTQARHAARLIQQILDFSRRAVFERQPLDILPLVKEQIQILRRTLPENIEITLNYDPGAYIINADPTRMQQMLTNLALNARDAMAEGGVLSIVLKRRRVVSRQTAPLHGMQPGPWAQLIVADSGIGITSEVLPHIFEPFFTTKAPGKGSGLGLPQVYGIVEAHEGFVDVQSEVSQGTVFTIYLPLTRAKGARLQDVEEPLSLMEGHGETILVVEDNAATREAVVESLELLQYQTLSAENGRQALIVLREHLDTVDLVLSDVVMPEMSGIALVHAMQEEGMAIRVVMMTGHPLEQTLDVLQEQDIADWMTKPVTLERLAEAIARGLERLS